MGSSTRIPGRGEQVAPVSTGTALADAARMTAAMQAWNCEPSSETVGRRAHLFCFSARAIVRLRESGLLRFLGERGARVRSESLSITRATELEEADVVVLTSNDELLVETVAMLRRVGLTMGIAVLAEPRMEAEEERLLDAGADLVVPLRHDARATARKLEALARRVRTDWTRGGEPASGDFRIDVVARSIRARGKRVELSATDFRLFLYFVDQASRWVSEARIIRDVFGTFHAPGASIVRVHICSLRKALEPLGLRIHNRRSVGYRLAANRDRS